MEAVVPATRDAWHSVLASDPHALPSQTPEWMDAMCAGSVWRDASRLYVTGSGRRIVMPMVQFGRGPLAWLISPRLGWGYGGIIADGGVEAGDVALISADLAKMSKFCLWLRPNPLQAETWQRFAAATRRVEKISHIVDLEGGEAAVRARLHPSALKGMKTANKMKVRIETRSGGALLPVYFDLVVRSRAFWAQRQNEPVWLAQLRGRLREPERKWQTAARHLGEAFQVTVAWHGEKPAAVGLVVTGRNSHGMRAALDPAARNLGASHMLNWVVLQNACTSGARWFHMGESASAGAADFKESFGAKAHRFEEFCFEQLPISGAAALVRGAVKKMIGFREEYPEARSERLETK